tara:strand:+ start:90 stop:428 length:339 start_codon:yes stop_codon:yes gene_type:complete
MINFLIPRLNLCKLKIKYTEGTIKKIESALINVIKISIKENSKVKNFFLNNDLITTPIKIIDKDIIKVSGKINLPQARVNGEIDKIVKVIMLTFLEPVNSKTDFFKNKIDAK